MKKITINFTVLENGEIQADQSLLEIVSKLLPWAYSILLRLLTHIRSPEQNAWYWVICTFLSKNTEYWWTKDEWHEFFSQNLLSNTRVWPWWKFLTVIRSTTDLDTIEFTEYIEKILLLCELPLDEWWLWIPRKFLLPKLKWLEPPF